MFEFKKRYNFVDACPHCGSNKTGYTAFFSTQKACIDYTRKALYKGEIVEAIVGIDEQQELFCKDCNFYWFGKPIIKYLTYEEINKQKEIRGITDDMIFELSLFGLSKHKIKHLRNNQDKNVKNPEPKTKKKKTKKKKIRIKE